MNVSRFITCGRRVFDKFCPVNSATASVKSIIKHSMLLYSSFNPHGPLKSSELTLTPFIPLVLVSRGMKVRGNLQLRCKNCYLERKDGIMYVSCSSYPRHKQIQKGKKKAKYNWIITFASQSKYRPY